MPKIPRYLITTADERTWKLDRPVLFLGEWCRLYDRKHIWEGMDAIVQPPYGLDKKDADNAEALMLEERLFPLLCDALNRHHGMQRSMRFWKIVLGHWFRRFVSVVINRVRVLEKCFEANQISGTTALSNDCYSLATLDSCAAIWAFSDDRWNNALYMRILDLQGTNISAETITSDESEGFRWQATSTQVSIKRKILRWGFQRVSKLASVLSKDSDAFIINSYLPLKEAIKLHLSLGQMPQLYSTLELQLSKRPDQSLRQSLSNQIVEDSYDNLSNIMLSLVFDLLPVCYLEGFTELTEKMQRLPWPKSPRFIFTSNNFDTDELFKLWAATKAEDGYKYFVGQHGNNYGTRRHMFPSIEESTSDKFLTWGWSDGLPQHFPAFVFTTAGRKPNALNPRGGLLLVENCMNFNIPCWDITKMHEDYCEDQQCFIEALAHPVRKNVTIRLMAGYERQMWNVAEKWQQFDPELKIDSGRLPFGELLSQSRLVVYSFDTTGILESLSQNIPALAFWQNGFDHLRESAKPYYQLLVDAGIVHLTAESAAQKVNEVWNDVDGWWAQRKVQDARQQFCARYARVSDNAIRDLVTVLSA